MNSNKNKSDDSDLYMKKLTQGEILSFSSINITINVSSYSSIIIIGMIQFIGAVILACSRSSSSSSFKIIDLINLKEFDNEHWITFSTNNQLIFRPTSTITGNSRGIIIKNNY